MPPIAHGSRVARIAEELDDLRVGTGAVVVGMDEDVAELAGQALVLLDVQFLVAEEDDAVRQQRRANGGHQVVIQLPAQLNAGQFGAQCAGNGMHPQLSA
jgi:hypothetical protein